MRFTFAPGVSACDADGQLILLDLRRDRYRRLVGRSERCVRDLVAGRDDTDPVAESALLGQGVLMASEGRRPPAFASAPPPTRSALDEDAPSPPRAGELATAARELLAARWRLRSRGLASSLADDRATRACDDRPTDEAGLSASAARFEAVRRVLSGRDRCLPDSLALRGFLAREGVGCALVLAVRTAPFSAHCWVQSGALVLNDSVDGVQPFTPILVV